MCTQATVNLISEVVQEKVQNNELFTAFDISLEVKKRATAAGETPERHREMKSEIHQQISAFLNMNIYERTLKDVGAPESAYVYFPVGGNADNYVPVTRSQSAAPSPAATSASATGGRLSSSRPSYNRGDTARLPDSRGVICVPNHLIKKIGLNAGETAYVYQKDADTLAVTRDASLLPGIDVLSSYTVDSSYNVRITSVTLGKGGLTGSLFDFDLDGTEVLIRVHRQSALKAS
jgi:hypothetical protein